MFLLCANIGYLIKMNTLKEGFLVILANFSKTRQPRFMLRVKDRITHHNLKHTLPQPCITYNDVFLLIISTKV